MIQLELMIRLFLGLLFGAIIGWEREKTLRPAGLRTHMLVCLGSTLATILSLQAFPESDQSRVAAAILTGMGFIGAGTILKTKDKVIGLTTAASLWTVSTIGIATGARFYLLAAITTLLAYVTLRLSKLEQV